MNVHVLHILGPLRPSGMERMLVTASSYFTHEKVQNTVLGQGLAHPYSSELRDAGYDVRTIPYAVGSKSGIRYLKALVRDLGIDVIHIHTERDYLRTAVASWLAMRRTRAVVRTIHNVFLATGTWRLKRLIQAQIADRLVHCVIAPSPEVAAQEASLSRKVDVIYNWVDDVFYRVHEEYRDRRPSAKDDVVAVIVGNCSNIKNHELALTAIANTNHKVIHLGNESDASEDELALLRAFAEDGRLVGRGVEPPQDALVKGSYFMMSSRHEGMGVALAEALVVGLPCLVNDVPGLRWAGPIDGVEVVPNREESWVVAVKSMPKDGSEAAGVSIDFSAARGSREYAAVYRAAAAHLKSRRNDVAKGEARVAMD